MIGAIIGDIVGSRFEFNNTRSRDFELFTKDCDFTDDTICTVAVADAILHEYSEDGDVPDVDTFKCYLRAWCHKYPSPMGAYGGSFDAWLRASDAQAQPYNSAACTHNHVEGIIGAVTTALVIRTLRDNCDNKASALLAAEEVMTHTYGEDWAEQRPVCGKFDVTCQGCVPLAFYIIENSHSFEDAIRYAIAYGGDSDTVGAIVGSMAEALYGVPSELCTRAKTYLSDDMKRVVSAFYDRFCTI